MSLEIRSLVQPDGQLALSLADVPAREPAADEVVVRVEASPLNPSDLGLLLAMADLSTLKASGTADRPVVTANIPERVRPALASRQGESMPVGNEGAGVVVQAGASPAAQALLGKTVSMIGGGMYTQMRTIRADQCQALPEGTTPAEGASWFVNPMTALSMTEVMKREGQTALVHTAAASNLGQMLNKICLKDGIALVNIVRKPEQAALLRQLGAQHVVDSSAPSFIDDLTNALAETGATLAFDAIGGGKLASQILSAMEVAINRTAKVYSRYGSAVHKQVYLYGSLDRSTTEIVRNIGMAWGVGGWLLTPFLQKIGAADTQRLKQRVASELKTTFASRYTREVSLAEALSPEAIGIYGKAATGEKFLINPNGV